MDSRPKREEALWELGSKRMGTPGVKEWGLREWKNGDSGSGIIAGQIDTCGRTHYAFTS